MIYDTGSILIDVVNWYYFDLVISSAITNAL